MFTRRKGDTLEVFADGLHVVCKCATCRARLSPEELARARVEPDGRPPPGGDVSKLPPAGEWTAYRRSRADRVGS